MEIIPFMRLTGRRILLLWILGGTAAALAGTYARTLPVVHTGSTTVFLERVYTGDRYQREAFVANYKSAVESLPAVHEVVGQQLGLTGASVASAVTAAAPDQGDIVYVKFESTDAELAQRGSSAVAAETLRTLIRTELDSARASLGRVSATEAEAQSALRTVAAPFAITDLAAGFEALDLQVMGLEAEVAKTPADATYRTNLEILLQFRRDQRVALGAALPEYERLLSRWETAKTAADQAIVALETVEERLAVAQNDEAIAPSGIKSGSVSQQSIRYAGAAGIAVITLTFAAFLIIETVAQSARRRRAPMAAPVLLGAERRVDPPTPLYAATPPTESQQQSAASGRRRS